MGSLDLQGFPHLELSRDGANRVISPCCDPKHPLVILGIAQHYALAIGQLPNTVLVTLDEGLARQAAALAAEHKLRDAHAVYLATASLFVAELATLDREQLARGAKIVQTLTPAGFVATT